MSVYKPKNSPYYHFDFRWRGSRFHGSTGKTARREAEAVEGSERDKLKFAESRGARAGSAMAFDMAAGRYWTEVGQYSAERDLDTNIARLVEWIGTDTPLSAVDDELLSRLVARRRGEPRMGKPALGLVSAGTVNRTVTELLRRILTRARTVWKIPLPDEPAWRSHKIAEPGERIRELTFDEEARIERVERDDYRPARLFAQATGLRRNEVVSLTWAQVDWHAGVIRVVGKGEKPRGIPITPEITDILWPLRDHHRTAVFTYIAKRTRTCARSDRRFIRGKRYPVTYEGWASAFRRTVAKAEIEDFRLHDLRHTAGTRTLRGSKNLRAVQHLLEHSDVKTTTRYAHALLDDVAEAMTARVDDEAARRAAHNRRTDSRKTPEASGGKT